jgi:hypothetical protein
MTQFLRLAYASAWRDTPAQHDFVNLTTYESRVCAEKLMLTSKFEKKTLN